MTTITFCDKCKKRKQGEERWPNLSISPNDLKIKGLDEYYQSFHFCTKCGKIIFAKIAKLLSNKKYGE